MMRLVVKIPLHVHKEISHIYLVYKIETRPVADSLTLIIRIRREAWHNDPSLTKRIASSSRRCRECGNSVPVRARASCAPCRLTVDATCLYRLVYDINSLSGWLVVN